MLGASKRVWIFSDMTDMRKGYDGLYALCRKSAFDVLNGDLFLFISHDMKQAKVLFWDGTGLRILMKRMEKNRFARIFDRGEMTYAELDLFLDGAKLLVKVSLPPPEKYSA
jgi:transposase